MLQQAPHSQWLYPPEEPSIIAGISFFMFADPTRLWQNVRPLFLLLSLRAHARAGKPFPDSILAEASQQHNWQTCYSSMFDFSADVLMCVVEHPHLQ